MGVTVPVIAQGARVEVQRGPFPTDPRLLGRSGRVVDASEYRAHKYGVVLDGESDARYFRPEELKVVEAPALPPEREAAKARRALP